MEDREKYTAERAYLDAGVLVKRYVNEAGSVWLRSLLSSPQADFWFTSRMTIVEVISAFGFGAECPAVSRN